ncbi:hypothetical protein LINGRAHAP2_LOCUS13434 [Linum grandiflorum]
MADIWRTNFGVTITELAKKDHLHPCELRELQSDMVSR